MIYLVQLVIAVAVGLIAGVITNLIGAADPWPVIVGVIAGLASGGLVRCGAFHADGRRHRHTAEAAALRNGHVMRKRDVFCVTIWLLGWAMRIAGVVALLAWIVFNQMKG